MEVAMTSDPKRSVIIVGGGIGGLAAALALARKGIAVRVFEQASEFAEIGAGLQLGPNVYRMFECLGITSDVNELAVFPEHLLMLDSITGQEVTRIALDERFRNRFTYPYAVIHRADLHRVLLARNRQEQLVQLSPGTRIVAIDEGSNRTTVHTECGERYSADALIGADGLWSTIRSLIVNDGKPTVSGHIAYRAVLPTS
jgi:3-hydroxybenzoate 6-monooxygenase